MREFRKHFGLNVNVVDVSGESFRGRLIDASKEAITVEVEEYWFADGERGPNLAGHVVFLAAAVRFVQVL